MIPYNYSLVMMAHFIPDQTTVYKVNGQTPYTLRRGLKIYGDDGKIVFEDAHHCYLIGGAGHVNGVMSGKKLRIDFEGIDEVQDFLELLKSKR